MSGAGTTTLLTLSRVKPPLLWGRIDISTSLTTGNEGKDVHQELSVRRPLFSFALLRVLLHPTLFCPCPSVFRSERFSLSFLSMLTTWMICQPFPIFFLTSTSSGGHSEVAFLVSTRFVVCVSRPSLSNPKDISSPCSRNTLSFRVP